MIPHQEFSTLRLGDFVAEVAPLAHWQFMGQEWVGEAAGFNEWLRPADDPDRLGSLSLDFHGLPAIVAASILRQLQLTLAPGMTLEEISERLGEPVEKQAFVPDRCSYDFKVHDGGGYDVSCTVHQNEGLIYLVVMKSHDRHAV